MTTKSSRHKMVEVSCEYCGDLFMARKQRVDKGQSRFCSRKHYNLWLKENPQSSRIGKENAGVYLDKIQNRYYVQWIDDGKKINTTWSNWAWEMNFGEVPEGYRVGFKDGNPMNNVLENLYLQSYAEWGEIVAEQNRGREFSEEARSNMSKGRDGLVLSDEHKKNISLSMMKKWKDGAFDKVHKGKYNHYYKDGKSKPYPPEYYEIRSFIKDRDNYVCQICGKSVYRSRHGHVHHIDGNKYNNDQDNLILFCSTCHSKVHHPTDETPPTILAFSNKLVF